MSEHYFQFPISALRLGLQGNHRWGDVLAHACLHYGRRAMEATPPEVVDEAVKQYLAKRPSVTADTKSADQRALVFGFDRLGVIATAGNFRSRLNSARQIEEDCAAAPFPTVRIKTDFWWDTFTPAEREHSIAFREFAVLCAVYAAIGAKPYAKASLQMLQRYAAGYPKANDFAAASRELIPGSLFLSLKQLRLTLANLEALGFFAKFTYNRGECFFSNKMNRAELAAAVAAKKLRKLEAVAQHRREDQARSLEIVARRRAALSPLNISPDALP